MDTSPTIQSGNSVLLEINGEKKLFVVVKTGGCVSFLPHTSQRNMPLPFMLPDSPLPFFSFFIFRHLVRIGQDQCNIGALLGSPWGSLFTLCKETNELKPVKHTPLPDWDDAEVKETNKDNSLLIDGGFGNQNLRDHHIEEMKKDGKSGDDIVAALLANSATFHKKTEFSQEKYKRKKTKKYITTVCARRPTPTAVCELYYSRYPSQIGGLRLDILSLMLSLANVSAFSRVLVVENTGGLLTAAVVERVGGFGEVVTASLPDWRVKNTILRQFNFCPKGLRSMSSVQLTDLLAGRAKQQKEKEEKGVESGQPSSKQQQQGQQNGTGGLPAGEYSGDEDDVYIGLQLLQQQQQQQQKQQEVAQKTTTTSQLPTLPFTSCLIALHGISPTEILKTIAPLMAPCANFAILYSYLQPLADAQIALRKAGIALNLEIKDSFWREHQVAPRRTHPMINMDHGGGYVLSGTFIPNSKIELGKISNNVDEIDGVKKQKVEQQSPPVNGVTTT